MWSLSSGSICSSLLDWLRGVAGLCAPFGAPPAATPDSPLLPGDPSALGRVMPVCTVVTGLALPLGDPGWKANAGMAAGTKPPPSRAKDGPRAKGLRGTGVRPTTTLRGVPMLTALAGRDGMKDGVRLGGLLPGPATTTALRPGGMLVRLLALLLLPRADARRRLRSSTQPAAAAAATAATTPTAMPAMAPAVSPPPSPPAEAAPFVAAAALPGPLQLVWWIREVRLRHCRSVQAGKH